MYLFNPEVSRDLYRCRGKKFRKRGPTPQVSHGFASWQDALVSPPVDGRPSKLPRCQATAPVPDGLAPEPTPRDFQAPYPWGSPAHPWPAPALVEGASVAAWQWCIHTIRPTAGAKPLPPEQRTTRHDRHHPPTASTATRALAHLRVNWRTYAGRSAPLAPPAKCAAPGRAPTWLAVLPQAHARPLRCTASPAHSPSNLWQSARLSRCTHTQRRRRCGCRRRDRSARCTYGLSPLPTGRHPVYPAAAGWKSVGV